MKITCWDRRATDSIIKSGHGTEASITRLPKLTPRRLFAKSVERNFGIESHLFRKSHFDHINKFVAAHSYNFTPLESLHDNVTYTDDDSDLVADVDPDTLIRIVRSELTNGKAPGIDNVYNDIHKKAIGTGFCNLLVRAFTISLKLGFIPCLEGTSSPLYAHQAWQTAFTNY